MEHMRLPPVLILPVTCLVLLAGSACQELPTIPGDDVQVLQVGALERLNPGDVVVAPVQFAVDGLDVPELELRTAISNALASRRYSPLDIFRIRSIEEANDSTLVVGWTTQAFLHRTKDRTIA